MATTTGLVSSVRYLSDSTPLLTVAIEYSPGSFQDLDLHFSSADSARVLFGKQAVANLLVKAQMTGYSVDVTYQDGGTEIIEVSTSPYDISPIDRPIHNDAFGISGSDIPADVQVVFDSSSVVALVPPDIVRPHWVFISNLPPEVPTGRGHVSLQSQGSTWTSDNVPVSVRSGPVRTRRVMYPGAPKPSPYSIVFVATPAYETDAGGVFTPDLITQERYDFNGTVGSSMRALFMIPEDLLYQNGMDRNIRLVSIFDSTLAANDSNALLQLVLSINKLIPRRNHLNPFVSRYGEQPDVAFIIHANAAHAGANAIFTSDEVWIPLPSGPFEIYTYDGANKVHGHFARIPGSVSLHVNRSHESSQRNYIQALHEFGHAAGDSLNGKISDLYHDNQDPLSLFEVNKKYRSASTDPVPLHFADYNLVTEPLRSYQSDLNRDGAGYPASWTSYHPELRDPTLQNVMDSGSVNSRFDYLTYDFLTDRILAKMRR